MNRNIENLIVPFLVGLSGVLCFFGGLGLHYPGLYYIGFLLLWLGIAQGVVAIMDHDEPKV